MDRSAICNTKAVTCYLRTSMVLAIYVKPEATPQWSSWSRTEETVSEPVSVNSTRCRSASERRRLTSAITALVSRSRCGSLKHSVAIETTLFVRLLPAVRHEVGLKPRFTAAGNEVQRPAASAFGRRITASPSRMTSTTSTVKRKSFGSRTAWKPAHRTFRAAFNEMG